MERVSRPLFLAPQIDCVNLLLARSRELLEELVHLRRTRPDRFVKFVHALLRHGSLWDVPHASTETRRCRQLEKAVRGCDAFLAQRSVDGIPVRVMGPERLAE